MTSEIVIMNRLAIAIAADSAVTLYPGEKIYKTANKLFALTKFHPVGIMFFNSAEVNGVPWETIIKIYRKHLGLDSKNTIQDYFSAFIEFLDANDVIFPPELQKIHYSLILGAYFYAQRIRLDEKIESILQQNNSISDDEILILLYEIIDTELQLWEKLENAKGVDDNFMEEIIIKYEDEFNEVKNDVFKNFPINDDYIDKLKELSSYVICKEEEFDTPFNSGVVIMGFGDKQVFPSMISFKVKIVLNDKLIYCNIDTSEINQNVTATISPFAQEEEIIKFLEGVGPEYRIFIRGYLTTMFKIYPEILINQIPKLNQEEKEELLNEFKLEGKKLHDDFVEKENTIVELHVDPILAVVNSLPKEELAVMAETLINLTSFKRKMSLDKETVGGPIDVAIISRGDGFIWIKRKHYFRPDLNPQFFKK